MSFHPQQYYIHFSSIDVMVPMTIPFQQLVANNYRDLPEEIRELILSPISRTIIYPQNTINQRNIVMLSPIFTPIGHNSNVHELSYESESDSDSDSDLPDLIHEDDFIEDEYYNNFGFYNDISRNVHTNKKECRLNTGYRRKNIGLE
jgi:hypothetical protein